MGVDDDVDCPDAFGEAGVVGAAGVAAGALEAVVAVAEPAAWAAGAPGALSLAVAGDAEVWAAGLDG